MTAALVALLLAIAPATAVDPVAPTGPPVDTPAVSVETLPDSQALAKLEAVQRAWDGDSLARSSSAPSGTSVGSLLAQILASLAVLGGLLGFGLILLRRVRQKSSQGAGRGAGSMLDVLETRGLGQGNHLTLVRVHDRVLALGHGPGGVAPVAEFTGTDAARILADHGDGAVSVRDFTATLDTFLDRFRNPPPTARTADPEDSR